MKVYNSPKTSWCLALAELNCGRNHCDSLSSPWWYATVSSYPGGTVLLLVYHFAREGEF